MCQYDNMTKRPCIDVRAEFARITPVNVEGGQIKKTELLPLKRDRLFDIGPFSKKDKDARYEFRFICYRDINKLLDDNSTAFLRMAILATDSVSGRTKVFTKEYYSLRSQIKEGAFPKGTSMEIK